MRYRALSTHAPRSAFPIVVTCLIMLAAIVVPTACGSEGDEAVTSTTLDATPIGDAPASTTRSISPRKYRMTSSALVAGGLP